LIYLEDNSLADGVPADVVNQAIIVPMPNDDRDSKVLSWHSSS
jgi:hypothetical protein